MTSRCYLKFLLIRFPVRCHAIGCHERSKSVTRVNGEARGCESSSPNIVDGARISPPSEPETGTVQGIESVQGIEAAHTISRPVGMGSFAGEASERFIDPNSRGPMRDGKGCNSYIWRLGILRSIPRNASPVTYRIVLPVHLQRDAHALFV
jgi:hypothetical protein